MTQLITNDYIVPVTASKDYVGHDGLLYCGQCNTPKEAFYPNGICISEKDRHPVACQCRRLTQEDREKEEQLKKHQTIVETLQTQCFTDATMRRWTFSNDNGNCPQLQHARFYVEHWQTMLSENIGYLLWGSVGTGKSYFAGCIANALIAQEIPVLMNNFSIILNDLSGFEGRNAYLSKLCSYPLLILDDFGMERNTEFALEQIFNVIDWRYRSKKPLIVTTNLSLHELQNPQDTAHARIYDRLLEMCAPIRFVGETMRKETAQQKLKRLKELMKN